MPLCARTSTYFTGIAGEVESDFGLAFVAACACCVLAGLCTLSIDTAAARARIAAQAEAAPTNALPDKSLRRLIAYGRRLKAPSARIAREHSPASVRSTWTAVPALAPAPARFDSHRGRPRCCP